MTAGAEPGVVTASRLLAAERHEGQARRAAGTPYAEHVAAVAGILADHRFDPDVVAAGFLHDVVEHTDTGPEELGDAFGPRVRALVEAMTDREEIEDWTERKDEHRDRVAAAGRDARAVYGADKLCGIREARVGWAEHGPLVEERLGRPLGLRLAAWAEDLEMLRGTDPPLPFCEEMAQALGALAEESATAPRS
ncbi:MAG TPA: HD domain-containing protein [Solirubrobacterales bacterium]|nr:HD domain-containing protein [Solirubrobacterales bacterium]